MVEITEEQFEVYEQVRKSGITNMAAANTVGELSGLDRETIIAIRKDYSSLAKKYLREI